MTAEARQDTNMIYIDAFLGRVLANYDLPVVYVLIFKNMKPADILMLFYHLNIAAPAKIMPASAMSAFNRVIFII